MSRMSGKVVLDTNIIIGHFRDEERYLEQLANVEYFIPHTVLGELYSGAYHSANPGRHIEKLRAFLARGNLLDNDIETNAIYGEIWASLAAKGQLIPTNDIWIAAIAQQHNLPLITADAHFKRINGLVTHQW